MIVRLRVDDLMVHFTLFTMNGRSGRANTYFFNVSQVKVNEILQFIWHPTLPVQPDLSPCKRAQDLVARQRFLMRTRETAHQPGEDFIQLREGHTRGTTKSLSLENAF